MYFLLAQFLVLLVLSDEAVLLFYNKTLGRAQDPCAKGAWLNKLTE